MTGHTIIIRSYRGFSCTSAVGTALKLTILGMAANTKTTTVVNVIEWVAIVATIAASYVFNLTKMIIVFGMS